MRLFMRPITPRPSVYAYRTCPGGGYRALQVIGATIIALAVIGLAGGLVIHRSHNSFKFLNNLKGQDVAGQNLANPKENNNNYYPGSGVPVESYPGP
jgi:hypothetical protein